MRPVRRPKEPIAVKPLYGVTELAAALGITRHRLLRLLQMHDVVIYRVGRSDLVPLSELQRRLPPLWASLRDPDDDRAD